MSGRGALGLPGARVPFQWRWFLRKLVTLLRDGEAPRRVAGEAGIRLALLGAAQAGWLADELLAPSWRRAPFSGPLFVLGHQRSGTTLLHRLLAADGRMRALRLHEQLLPAVSLQRGLAALGAADAHLGGRLAARFHALEERLFAPLDAIHRLRFREIEEDEFVLWGLFASAMAGNDTPRAAASPALDGLRDFDAWRPRDRRAALGYYRAVLQKAAYRDGRGDGGPWLLAKNPAFTHKVAALRAVFPGARFVQVHRDPLEAIPSRLSLVRAIWRRRVPGFDAMTPAQVETLLADSIRTYRAAMHNSITMASNELVVVQYAALRDDPGAEVRRIFERLGLGAPDAALVRAVAALPTRHRSGHGYRLEDFGLTPEGVAARLGEAAAAPPDPQTS